MLALIEPSSNALQNYMTGYRTPIMGPSLQDGGSIGEFLSAIAPHALNIGKALISNPEVQKSAQEIGKAGLSQIMKGIQSRNNRQQGKGLSRASRAKLNSLMTGGCLKILQ
jgi:hypothetical protein